MTSPPQGNQFDVTHPVADKDVARTFGESGVSLTHNKTRVVSESVEFDLSTGTTADRPDDNNSTSQSDGAGQQIEPQVDLAGVEVEISANVSGNPDLYLTDPNLNEVDSVTGVSAGETHRLLGDLSANTKYNVVLYNGGNSYTAGFNDGTQSYPYTSSDVDQTAQVFDAEPGGGGPNTTTTRSKNIDTVTALKDNNTSGSVTVEWSYPDDVYAWDVAAFTRTLDSETVDVYIEELQSGSWTEIAGPISRGDSIPADPANEVRFRVELSRASTSNNPTLDSIARRWKL